MYSCKLSHIMFVIFLVSCTSVGCASNTSVEEIDLQSPVISIDANNNAIICYKSELHNPYGSEIYYSQIDDEGGIITSKKILDGEGYMVYFPKIISDKKDCLHVFWGWEKPEYSHSYYMKLDQDGNRVIKPMQLNKPHLSSSGSSSITIDTKRELLMYINGFRTKDNISSNFSDNIINKEYIEMDINGDICHRISIDKYSLKKGVRMKIDSNNDIILILSEQRSTSIKLDDLQYIIINKNGNVLCKKSELTDLAVSPEFSIFHDYYQNNICLLDNGIVDSYNNIHIITSSSYACTGNSASLLYTKLNRTGTKLIENLTIATHEKKKGYDHGPAIFDPKVAIDSEDNIHITWSSHDEGNQYSIWYEKIDSNGTVLIPAMKIAPEEEKSEETPGFELGSLIILLVVVVLFMRRSNKVV